MLIDNYELLKARLERRIDKGLPLMDEPEGVKVHSDAILAWNGRPDILNGQIPQRYFRHGRLELAANSGEDGQLARTAELSLCFYSQVSAVVMVNKCRYSFEVSKAPYVVITSTLQQKRQEDEKWGELPLFPQMDRAGVNDLRTLEDIFETAGIGFSARDHLALVKQLPRLIRPRQ